MTITTVEYYVGDQLLRREPMMLSRCHLEGEAMTLNSVNYEVKKVLVDGHVQKVTLKPCEICKDCGGIRGKRTPPAECVCR